MLIIIYNTFILLTILLKIITIDFYNYNFKSLLKKNIYL